MMAASAMLFAHATLGGVLEQKVWTHGSADCSTNRDPPIEVFQFDPDTYILRQNKCVHFEAPFVYVLFGERTVLVQDTGATPEPEKLPLYATIQQLIAQRNGAGGQPLGILVTHSHSHSDHKAGDAQFRGQPGVTLVEPTAEGVRGYFGFKDWPNGQAAIDLGARQLLVLPIPGHQAESIALYDARTGWLLTGDTVYPGRLYVSDWDAYRASVHRLAQFATTHPVSAVLGSHIEMSRTPGKDFPMGSTFQPGEAPLPLSAADLASLDQKLQQAGGRSQRIEMAKVIVRPITLLERVVSKVVGWFTPG